MLKRISILALLWVAATTVAANDHPSIPAPGDTFVAPLATEAMLLDGTYVDGRIVVVGERGIVLISDDDGETWRQTPTGTRATLTGVHFSDRLTGWVVGHDTIILHTYDGGDSWKRVYFDPDDQRPLFDVWFADASHGIVVGAYGLFMTTRDGGASWDVGELIPEPWPDLETIAEAEDDPDEFDFEDDQYYDFHLNHIAAAENGDLYIAAEAGNFFRSGDGGETWYSMPTVYNGSFFNTLPLDGSDLLLMGMRGNLFASSNGGEAYTQIETPVTVLLNDGAVTEDGTILIGGMAGALLVSTDGGRSFTLFQQRNRKAISTLIPVPAGIVVVGEAGVHRLSLSELEAGGAS